VVNLQVKALVQLVQDLQVKGPIEAVSDADYPQGESFDIGGVKSSPVIGVK
jgi:hypothetical protein